MDDKKTIDNFLFEEIYSSQNLIDDNGLNLRFVTNNDVYVFENGNKIYHFKPTVDTSKNNFDEQYFKYLKTIEIFENNIDYNLIK